MAILIAGFGDLGAELAHQIRLDPQTSTTTVFAIRRHWSRCADSADVFQLSADLTNVSDLTVLNTLRCDITTVIYCPTPDARSESAYRDIYISGLKNLIAAIESRQQKTAAQWVMVSSTAVYSNQAEGWVTESTAPCPSSFNGNVLLEAERLVLSHDMNALITRLSGIYGPKKQHLIQALKDGNVRLPHDPGYWANRIHIEDAARAILHLILRNECGIFIVSDPEPIPLAHLYRSLASALHAPAPSPGPPSAMMGKKRASSIKLAATGFKFRWPNALDGYKAFISRGSSDINHDK